MTSHLAQCRRQVDKLGLLMLADSVLPSVTTIVAGEPVRGSWWGHRAGHDIFSAANALAEFDDIEPIKLVNGKVTFVHRTLWPAVVSVGLSREPWQLDGLTEAAAGLLGSVEALGSARTDRVPGCLAKEAVAAGHMLEQRLLVHAGQVHTEVGRHAKALTAWRAWADSNGLGEPLPPEAEAKQLLEAAAARLARGSSGRIRLPWQRR